MGQTITTTQFYLYGRNYFTRTGWEKARQTYTNPTFLDTIDLTERIYLVTGANSGIGFCLTEYLASKGATVYMVCRNQERAEIARKDITDRFPNSNIHIVVGDCGVSADVRAVMEQVRSRESKLDGLVCNAGALLNEKTLTREGIETTFATHLAFGTYLLTQLALPLLSHSADPRVVVVSSGGMYNTRFPSWATATAEKGSYDGQLAYAYAKRGQVLMCSHWAKTIPSIKFVSCHPGWTDTPGVTEAYGSQKKFLEPLRTLYQGTEGIMWLCTVPSNEIQSGEFYLDRTPQRQHLSGPFFSDGNFTKNTDQEVLEMVQNLDKMCSQSPN